MRNQRDAALRTRPTSPASHCSPGRPARAASSATAPAGWGIAEIEEALQDAGLTYEHPVDVVQELARCLAANGLVGWASGPANGSARALGCCWLLGSVGDEEATARFVDRADDTISILVLDRRAAEIFGPSRAPDAPLSALDMAADWLAMIPAVGRLGRRTTVRTIDGRQPLLMRLLTQVERRTALPLVIHAAVSSSDGTPRDALRCFASLPVTMLAIGDLIHRDPR